MLSQIGKSSFMYAWVLDGYDTERERGVTIGICSILSLSVCIVVPFETFPRYDQLLTC